MLATQHLDLEKRPIDMGCNRIEKLGWCFFYDDSLNLILDVFTGENVSLTRKAYFLVTGMRLSRRGTHQRRNLEVAESQGDYLDQNPVRLFPFKSSIPALWLQFQCHTPLAAFLYPGLRYPLTIPCPEAVVPENDVFEIWKPCCVVLDAVSCCVISHAEAC